MNEKEMLDYIHRFVTIQGNQGASELTDLLLAMVEHMFKEPITGVTPIVVNIAEEGVRNKTRTTYEVTTPQERINAFIRSAFENQEKTRLFVEDKGALIGFSHVEIDELTLTGKVETRDGEFCIVLTKRPGESYFYHEEEITAIPQVTQGEVEAYNMLFGATYNKTDNQYKVLIGATEFSLTPAEMIIVNEEYNKTSTDGNYTAMWANSISRFICCSNWFQGFHAFNLHSAFAYSKKLEFVDLHTEVLPVSNLTGAFNGCSRLEQISGIMEMSDGALLTDAFKGCNTLRVFKMHSLSSNLDLSDCPMLAYEVFEELITYSTMADIKIYVHPTVDSNIKGNPLWAGVKDALNRKVNVQILVK